jgi:hypothetical protein
LGKKFKTKGTRKVKGRRERRRTEKRKKVIEGEKKDKVVERQRRWIRSKMMNRNQHANCNSPDAAVDTACTWTAVSCPSAWDANLGLLRWVPVGVSYFWATRPQVPGNIRGSGNPERPLENTQRLFR